MEDKKQIIESFVPEVVLRPMTEEALKAIPQSFQRDGIVGILKLPFRVGRESRVQIVNGCMVRIERPRIGNHKATNDLYLVDDGQKLNISRDHFLIERVDEKYYIVDRGSVCGTKINGQNIGGDGQSDRTRINDGDTISIGSNATPYIYRFIILDTFFNKSEERTENGEQ